MILLDSSAFYFALTKPQRFGPHSRARLAAGEEVAVSAISILELTIKQLRQKLPAFDLLAAAEHSALKVIDFDAQSALKLDSFPELERHDPFDRALLAQAYAGGYDFLTSDRILLSLGRGWIRDLGE